MLKSLNKFEKALVVLIAALVLVVAVAQVYKAGANRGYAEGYQEACYWADEAYSTHENDEVGALCMESEEAR